MNKIIDINRKGYVYVLNNDSMPGLLKIGYTTSSTAKRAKEISQGTGVPTPFMVAYEYYCFEPEGVESDVHRHLGSFRVANNREFFRCDLQIAKVAIAEVAGDRAATDENLIRLKREAELEKQKLEELRAERIRQNAQKEEERQRKLRDGAVLRQCEHCNKSTYQTKFPEPPEPTIIDHLVKALVYFMFIVCTGGLALLLLFGKDPPKRTHECRQCRRYTL